jgi:solute carrier family 25 phosphate transporter 23/24/25/41
MLRKVQRKLNDINTNIQEETNLNPTNYSKYVEKMKTGLISRLMDFYQNIPIFLVVNDINMKLNNEHQAICDQLNYEMTIKCQEIQREKTVKQYLKDLFYKKFDMDGNGSLSLEDLETIFNSMNLPASMAQELMLKVDTGKDGIISFAEFEQYTEKQIVKFHKIFDNLDSDNDSKLDQRQAKQSLYEVFPGLELSDDIYKNLFETMDLDKSGFITFEEWCQFLFLFPQMNLDRMVTQWKLYSITMMDPQQPSNAFFEKDIKVKNGSYSTSYWDILKIFLCGGISGGLSRTVTAPLERLKVLYQTMYTEVKPPTVLKGLKDVYVKSGFYGLYKGNSLSIFMSFLEQALRFAIIEYSKTHMHDEYGNIPQQNFLYIGVITGVLSTFMIFPFDVIRIRMMSSMSIQQKSGVIKEFRRTYHYFGYWGFYMGLIPHLMTVLPSGSLNVFFYNGIKKIAITDNDLEKPNIAKFMLLGGFAAYITGTVTYPLTLLTSRLIVANRDIKIHADRIGFFRIMANTYRNEGFNGFFKGYSACILRLFIAQSVNFGVYEKLKLNFVTKKKKYKDK